MLLDLENHSPVMREAISHCLWARQYESNAEEAVARYTRKGWEVGDLLKDFISRYSNMRFIFPGIYLGDEPELTTDVAVAVGVYPGWVAEAQKRAGVKMWPVGEAFETCEAVLLGEDGFIYLYGDAGLQRVGSGFPEAMLALVTDQWDTTFF